MLTFNSDVFREEKEFNDFQYLAEEWVYDNSWELVLMSEL